MFKESYKSLVLSFSKKIVGKQPDNILWLLTSQKPTCYAVPFHIMQLIVLINSISCN